MARTNDRGCPKDGRGVAAPAALLAILLSTSASAHTERTAYLELDERSPGKALVTLTSQVPIPGLVLSANAPCQLTTGESGGRLLECPGTIAGAHLTLDGLGPLISEAVVWSKLGSGASASTLLTADHPSFEVPAERLTWPQVARQYVGIGVKHILTGFDHLLFLLGLVVVLRKWRPVLLAETAFTLSHSLSFSASALGYVHVPTGPVEACIALSLVLVARETQTPSTPCAGATLAFVFGVVHGLGFAGGLSEAGLPQREIPAALLGFASGVELGQVFFLAAVLAIFWLARRSASATRALAGAATYGVGGVGAYLLIERLFSLFTRSA